MRNEFTDYIQHGHKYVAAVDVGQKNGKKVKRYFYSVPEYQAYLHGRKPAAEEASVGRNRKSGYNPIKISKNPIRNAMVTGVYQWETQKRRGRQDAQKLYNFTKKAEKKVKDFQNDFNEAKNKIKDTSNEMKEKSKQFEEQKKQFSENFEKKKQEIQDKIKNRGSADKKSSNDSVGKLVVRPRGDKTPRYDVYDDKTKKYAKQGFTNPAEAQQYIKENTGLGKVKRNLKLAATIAKSYAQIKSGKGNPTEEPKETPQEPQETPKQEEQQEENKIPAFIKDLKAFEKLTEAGFAVKSRETSPDEDCKDINPDWDPNVYKNAYNCAWCTFAFDLRRRGFDVDAGDIDATVENTPDEIKSWYKGAKWSEPSKGLDKYLNSEFTGKDKQKYVDIYNKKIKEGWDAADANTYAASNAAAKKLTEQIVKDANGDKESWGQTIVYWRGSEGNKDAGGHSIAYYQKDGKVTFYDCQTGEKINDMTDTLFCTGLIWTAADGSATYTYDGFVDCMRTDNKELALDDKKLKRSVEAGDDNPDTSKKNKNKKQFIDKY